VTKTNTSTADAFNSPELGVLGCVQGDRVAFYRVPVRRHTLNSEFDISGVDKVPDVEIAYGFENVSRTAIDAFAATSVDGIVYAGGGDGDPSELAEQALADARAKGTIIVRSARVGSGIVAMCGACFFLPIAANAADLITADVAPVPSLQFEPTTTYDDGTQTSVAAHPSGLFLEFHRTQDAVDKKIWYHVGTLDGTTVTWGPSQFSGAEGSWPSVAISNEGYVIVVHSNKLTKDGSDLYYQVGKIDPHGDQNQSITWLTELIHWDRGGRVDSENRNAEPL
jgi:hypothetical protein